MESDSAERAESVDEGLPPASSASQFYRLQPTYVPLA